MPRVSQQIQVEVRDHGETEEKRVVSVEIKANPKLFILSDLLSKEGALKSLENVILTSSKLATANYIESGKKLVKSINKNRSKK